MCEYECIPSNFGIGIDIENIDRFAVTGHTRSGSFLKKIFTPDELNYCFSKKMVAQHLTARYCAKEATIKALASIDRTNINYRDIEITNRKSGAPMVKIGKAGFQDLKIYLSLSHCKDKAIAFTIVFNTRQNNPG